MTFWRCIIRRCCICSGCPVKDDRPFWKGYYAIALILLAIPAMHWWAQVLDVLGAAFVGWCVGWDSREWVRGNHDDPK
jgi:hypothetical protein